MKVGLIILGLFLFYGILARIGQYIDEEKNKKDK